MMYEAGSEEQYEFHLAEARGFRWLGAAASAGVLAMTAYINFAEKLSSEGHAGLTAGGIAAAALTTLVFEKGRKEAIHDAHVSAALAVVSANVNRRPVPEWAKGNTGRIFERRELDQTTQTS